MNIDSKDAATVVTVATGNRGKLRDFQGAAVEFGIEVRGLPASLNIAPPLEDGATFAENARKKAAYYSAALPGALLIADDSGLEVEALGGAPGVHSARYAASSPHENASDSANNARLLAELAHVPFDKRGAQFVCVIAAARNGVCSRELFTGRVRGTILFEPRGDQGFGYDPLFWIPEIRKTFAEINPEEKARFSHRGIAFRRFMEWFAMEGSRR